MIISKNISPSWKLIISILFCETVGFISGLLSMVDINTWFNMLNKPLWNPPAYLFGPIWTGLYFLMGVAFWLIWKKNTLEPAIKRSAELVFILQLFLNFCWPILFFRCHLPLLALIDISLMIITTLITILYFMRISQLAAMLLVPYISWISFASVLNYAIWYMNQ